MSAPNFPRLVEEAAAAGQALAAAKQKLADVQQQLAEAKRERDAYLVELFAERPPAGWGKHG